MTTSQNKLIAAHLQSGKRITGLQALREFGIMHLPRRILDLKEAGMLLEKETIDVTKANGDKARVSEWRLAK